MHPSCLSPTDPLCFSVSDILESPTMFFKTGLHAEKLENYRSTGFMHLLSTYYVPDIVLGTGKTTVKRVDKTAWPQDLVF